MLTYHNGVKRAVVKRGKIRMRKCRRKSNVVIINEELKIGVVKLKRLKYVIVTETFTLIDAIMKYQLRKKIAAEI